MILAIFLSLYAVNPSESNPIHHFIFLSYRLPASETPGSDTVQYGKGPWDVAFVTFYTVVLSFTREFIMQEILRPMARRAGLKGRGKQARFMEQMYTALYFGLLGPAGMYVMSRTPVWYFNTKGMYLDFPHKTHEAVVKFYYLFQAAYWAQQAIVLLLGMEKPRKDFKELVGHHIVSLSLIGLSYRFHFTYIGLAVYVTHDISDFFLAVSVDITFPPPLFPSQIQLSPLHPPSQPSLPLPSWTSPKRTNDPPLPSSQTSKTLNYLDHALTGPYFFIFMIVWIYMRHYLNLRIIYSLFTEFKTIGPYEMDWEAGQFKCPLSNVITTTLLSALQALNLFWLFFIVRIAYRFVVHNVAEDDRSENEETEAEVEAEANQKDASKESKPLVNGNANANGRPKRSKSNSALKKSSR